MATVKLENVLATLDEIAKVAPTIAAATGLPATPLITELAAAMPEIHMMLDTLLALFQKHAAAIAAATSPAAQ